VIETGASPAAGARLLRVAIVDHPRQTNRRANFINALLTEPEVTGQGMSKRLLDGTVPVWHTFDCGFRPLFSP